MNSVSMTSGGRVILDGTSRLRERVEKAIEHQGAVFDTLVDAEMTGTPVDPEALAAKEHFSALAREAGRRVIQDRRA